MRERSIYLKLLADMEAAHRALDKVDKRVHELLDKFDEEEASRIQEQHQSWMDDEDDTSPI